MVVMCMPNSGHGGLPGTPFKTIFGSYVGRHFPNIQYFDVCGGIWRYVKLFGSIWRYMKVYEGIWRYRKIIWIDFFAIVFFQLFGGPLCRVRVWGAFEVRLRSVWGAFEMRLRCVWGSGGGFTGTTTLKPSELLTPRVHENYTHTPYVGVPRWHCPIRPWPENRL